jgi:hypothetical protein
MAPIALMSVTRTGQAAGGIMVPAPVADWTCQHCGTAQTAEHVCDACDRPRFASFAIQVAEHVLEHLADGLNEPRAILAAMQARPCYATMPPFTLAFIAQQMRLLTKDTTALARQLLKARAARLSLDVAETGDAKDKIALLKGIQVLGDRLEVTGQDGGPLEAVTVVRRIVVRDDRPQ